MKKCLAVILLSIYLCATTELYQLLKFPVLVEHFFEHKAKNSNISVLDFLALHYAGNHLQNHPHDDDYEQDQKLPFISHHDFLTIVFTPGSAVWFEIENHNLPVVKRKIASYNDAYLSGEIINAVWQPPKFC